MHVSLSIYYELHHRMFPFKLESHKMAYRATLLFLFSSLLYAQLSSHQTSTTRRENLDISVGPGIGIGIGIGIGGGGEASPPGGSAGCPPQPSDFLNLKQYNAYMVIQRFKKTITCDPMGITSTWNGFRPCNYTGFFCDTPPDTPNTPTIASIDFNGYRLGAPTVAGFIDSLPDLALFHANSNNFGGTVPVLTGLRYLFELDMSNNKLTGAFPTNVLPLPQLTFLDIRFNQFAGAVPAAVFLLGVGGLFLNNNAFNQPLPSNLGNTAAVYLTLANNGFTGPIPRSIGNTSATLLEVLFLNNRLSGCLPYEIGKLTRTTVFDAGFNEITGPIPLSFGCLKSVQQLNLAGNLLYGNVPDVVCWLAKTGQLANLSLSDNYFTSIGPSCWGLIKRGILNVRRNCLPDLPAQRPAAECERFFWKPKKCPLVLWMPCVPEHANAPPAADRLPSATYMSYSALQAPNGP